MSTDHPRRIKAAVLFSLLILLTVFIAHACIAAVNADQRHPLEVEALTKPLDVLKKMPAARAALAKGDHAGAAKLALAEANACRVIADWGCQHRAGASAIIEADQTTNTYLQVRSRVVLGRALSRLGDFNSAARSLAQAQRHLGNIKDDELLADILLAYSSVSERLGKLDESYRYAQQGLAHAPGSTQPEMRIRLLRNMAHVASQTNRAEEARTLLLEANDLLPGIKDPKLTAEVLLEEARSAYALHDADTVEEMGRRIGEIGEALQNSQLRGLSYETGAQALQMRGEPARAMALYQKSRDAFAGLHQYQDEMRVARAIVDLQLKGTEAKTLPQSIATLNELSDKVTRIERESAAADFEERLRYAQSDAQLATANAKTETERLRAIVNENRFRYTLMAGLLAGLLVSCTLAILAVLYMQQRKHAAMMRERGREMEIAVSTDFLTAVHSRKYITEAGNLAVHNAIDGQLRLAVAIVDIDHFKNINDTYGHASGDEVLKAVAAAMRVVCRDGDILGRFGGEEFAVLLQGISQGHALAAAERLRKAIADVIVHVDSHVITATASVGVACLAPEETEFDQLLIRADRALYQAKAEGRNRVVIAEEQNESIVLQTH